MLGALTTVHVVIVTSAVSAILTIAVTRRPGFSVLVGVLLFFGAAVGDARTQDIGRSELAPYADRQIKVRGWLARRPRISGYSRIAQVELKAAMVDGFGSVSTGETVLVRSERGQFWPTDRIGEEVVVDGRLKLPRQVQLGTGKFSWREYLQRRGISVEIVADRIGRGANRRGGIRGVVDQIRARSDRALGAGINSRFSSLSRGMVLGADENIDGATTEAFRRSGLAHLLAVSGQNVMLLVVLAVPLMSLTGFGYRTRLVVLLPLIGIYTLLTGADPPIQRAAVMATAGVIAALTGRRQASWYALLLAVAVTLVINPMAIEDAGWQLSFVAVVSIFWLAPKIEGVLHALPHALAQGAAITFAATIFTAPLSAYHFGRVSLVSLLANLLALPAVAPIMWLGMLGSAIGQIWIAPAHLINKVDAVCLAYLLRIAEWSAEQPYAVAQVSLPAWWQVALAYGVVVATVIAVTRLTRRLKGRGRAVALWGLVSFTLLTAVAWSQSVGGGSPPAHFTATFIDVGEGDSTLLQTPEGHAVLIDTGPPGARVVYKLQDLGVKQLDLVVLTHAQLDHHGGFADVLGRFRVHTLLDGGGADSSVTYRRSVTEAARRGANVIQAQAGQKLRLGRLTLRVLHPERAATGAPTGVDPNRTAIVLHASYGSFDLFLPSDAESDAWASFDPPNVELFKVAHHGSADEGLEMALKHLRPEVAVISVGRGNRFGHPNQGTVSQLRAAGSRILRTDRDGTTGISYKSGGIHIATESLD